MTVHLVDGLSGIDEEVPLGRGSAPVLLEVGGVQILDDVDGVLRHLGVEELEGRDHVVHMVAAVVEDDVGDAEFVDDAGEEAGVGLVADADVDTGALELSARWVDVDADDRRVRPEVALPHLQGASLGDTDLEHGHPAVDPGREVPLIGGEVVPPLVDDLIVIAHEVLPQRSHSASQN